MFSFHSFTCSCPVFPVPFFEEVIFVSLYILASFVKNKVPIGAWVHFWAFYLVPLVYISVFVPVPRCLVCSIVRVKSLSRVRLFAIPFTLLSMEFSRQEYWSGLPFPSPGDLLNPGMEPRTPALQALSSEPPGKS